MNDKLLKNFLLEKKLTEKQNEKINMYIQESPELFIDFCLKNGFKDSIELYVDKEIIDALFS